MGIQKKFFLLAGIVAVIMLAISCAGYYVASSALEEGINSEMTEVVESHNNKLSGWLDEKAALTMAVARNMHQVDDGTRDEAALRPYLNVIGEDKEVLLDVTIGREDKVMFSYHAESSTGKTDPTSRGWYKQGKAANGKLEWTEAYVDKLSNQLVVSTTVSYNDAAGKFRGVAVADVPLTVLKDAVKQIRYQGSGMGYIIDRTGQVLASDDEASNTKLISELPEFKEHEKAIMAPDAKGSFQIDKNGESQTFAFTTIPSTQWVIGLMVPNSVLYAPLTHMKLLYAVLILLGLVIIVFACLRFGSMIVNNVQRLHGHATKLADGDLSMQPLPVTSDDELGDLTKAFNVMHKNIHDLIESIAKASERLAASSEELTASAHQSAEAAMSVAETVTNMANGMSEQLTHVDNVRSTVQESSRDTEVAVQQGANVTTMTVNAADAAANGEKLMQQAVGRMDNIEKSVGRSAEVVAALGKNSEQIGAIVEAISNIAEQTNLLALNAAIEAARAGEHGRGFAVVADEVRKLAEQSKDAADQIGEKIRMVQNDTQSAVLAMNEGSGEVRAGADAIREVGTEFTNIVNHVQEIRKNMESIGNSMNTVATNSASIDEAVAGIQEISRTSSDQAQSISAATEEQSASMEEIAAASNSLAQLAEQMQHAIAKFKL